MIDTENVTFDMKSVGKKKAKTSRVKIQMEQEEKYNEIFRAGGCTYGDMNMSRHRDVYYDNNFPCGNHCPHCGTFWID